MNPPQSGGAPGTAVRKGFLTGRKKIIVGNVELGYHSMLRVTSSAFFELTERKTPREFVFPLQSRDKKQL